jgi:hypothetical protein
MLLQENPMTQQEHENPYLTFKYLVEEALDTVQYEIDQLARSAGSFDDNISENEVLNAWECGKSCGRLEVVQDLLEWLISRPEDHYRLPSKVSPQSTPTASNREHVACFLREALTYCANAADGTVMRLAIRLLSRDALTGGSPRSPVD